MIETPAPARPPVAAGPRPRRRRRLLALLRGLPAAYWICCVLGALNALGWALLTPSFQVPDEPVHAGYAQYVAETGKVPRALSARMQASIDERLAYEQVPFSLLGRPTWSSTASRDLRRALARPYDDAVEGGAGYAANNPPLYYYLEAVPYRIASSGNWLDRLFAMRFLSALLAGLTVGFVFLFVRELLPSTPWAWTVGALAVAFQPMFGFIGGGVNNDVLLWLCASAVLWLLARSLRSGLTDRRALAIGLFTAGGLLTKTSMFGLVPGVLLALGLAAWRTPPGPRRRRSLVSAGIAVAAAAAPLVAWLVLEQAFLSRSATGTTTGGLTSVTHTSLSGQLNYLWQFYLPRIPGTFDWFTHYPHYPLWQTYFQGFVGRFGWFQYGFPLWANELALGVLTLVLAAAVATLSRNWAAVRARLPELVTYLTLLAGIALFVGVAGYRYRVANALNFEQTRYLFPVIALYGGLVAVAARAGGRRFGPAVGALLVVLAAGHDLFAQLLTIARYYA